jgi:long-chain acyl-CoA synthetase
VKFGTVGPPIPGVEVKIAHDGEILAKGPNIMLGYYQNPEATSETVKDGWLHTGDIGELDDSGFLKITDRKKEILVMSNGKNVAPAPIEGRLKTSTYIEQAVLIGDNKKYISALIVPAYENLKLQAESLGLRVQAPEEWCKDPALHALIEKEIAQLSDGHLARYEQIKRFSLLPCEFSLERNEITPKLSLRRRNINENYATHIETMYDVSSKVS